MTTQSRHIGPNAWRSLGLAGALALIAAGCAPDTSNWSPAVSPKENKLVLVNLRHDVRFANGGGTLSPLERAALDAFLSRQQVGYGDRLFIVAGDSSALARQRAGAVDAYLRHQGLRAALLDRAEWAGAADNGTRLLVHRFVVEPPKCPDWRKPADTDSGNTESSNFGCANAFNLGQMVADPRDLMEGGTPGPMDGTRAASTVDRYRKDKTKPMLNIQTFKSLGTGK